MWRGIKQWFFNVVCKSEFQFEKLHSISKQRFRELCPFSVVMECPIKTGELCFKQLIPRILSVFFDRCGSVSLLYKYTYQKTKTYVIIAITIIPCHLSKKKNEWSPKIDILLSSLSQDVRVIVEVCPRLLLRRAGDRQRSDVVQH